MRQTVQSLPDADVMGIMDVVSSDNPGCCDRAAEVHKQCASLNMAPPFSGGCVHNIEHLAFHKHSICKPMRIGLVLRYYLLKDLCTSLRGMRSTCLFVTVFESVRVNESQRKFLLTHLCKSQADLETLMHVSM